MGAFGVIGAIGQKLHEQNLLNLQDKLNTHTAMLKMAQESAEKYPNLAPQYYNMALQIAATPIMKFDPKKFDLTAPRMEWERQQASQPKPQPPSVNPATPPPRVPEQNPFSLPTTGPASRETDQAQGNPQTLAPLAQAPSPPPGMQPSSAQLAIGGTPPIFGDLSQAPAFSPLHKMALDIAEHGVKMDQTYAATNKYELERQKGLENFKLDMGKQRLKALREAGIKVPPQVEAIVLSGLSIPGLNNSMRPVTSPSPVPGTSAPEGQLDIFGNPVGPGSYRVRTYPISGETEWVPAALALRTGFDESNKAVQYDPRVSGSAAAAGVVPPPMMAPKSYDLEGGGKGIASAAQIAAGQAPKLVPGSIGAGTPTTSVQHTPGLPDTVTSTRKGSGATSGSGKTQGSPRSSAVPSDSFPAAVKMTAEQVAKGEVPIPTDARTAGAVKQYLAEHGKEAPVPLAPHFQQLIVEIDPRLQSIRGLKARLEKVKNDDHRGYFTKARVLYKTGAAGADGQLANDIAQLSFTGLQSAGQLVKGMSRAYNVLDKGLEHTPNVWIDSPKLIYEKLTQLEDRLTEARKAAIEDGPKTGVLPSMTPPPGSSVVDKLVERYGGR